MKPSLVAFNMIIDACGKAGRDEEAVQAYVDLIECRHRPNAVTYTSLISAVAHAGRYEKADELYRRMLDDGLEPTGHTYVSMIHACAQRGWTRYGHEVVIMLHLFIKILLLTPLFMQCVVVQNEYNLCIRLVPFTAIRIKSDGATRLLLFKVIIIIFVYELPLFAFSRYAWRLREVGLIELCMGQCFICTSRVDGIPMLHQF